MRPNPPRTRRLHMQPCLDQISPPRLLTVSVQSSSLIPTQADRTCRLTRSQMHHPPPCLWLPPRPVRLMQSSSRERPQPRVLLPPPYMASMTAVCMAAECPMTARVVELGSVLPTAARLVATLLMMAWLAALESEPSRQDLVVAGLEVAMQRPMPPQLQLAHRAPP